MHLHNIKCGLWRLFFFFFAIHLECIIHVECQKCRSSCLFCSCQTPRFPMSRLPKWFWCVKAPQILWCWIYKVSPRRMVCVAEMPYFLTCMSLARQGGVKCLLGNNIQVGSTPLTVWTIEIDEHFTLCKSNYNPNIIVKALSHCT